MEFLTDFTYRDIHGFARFPGDSTALVIQSTRVTDGRTDGIGVAYTVLSIASHCKKWRTTKYWCIVHSIGHPTAKEPGKGFSLDVGYSTATVKFSLSGYWRLDTAFLLSMDAIFTSFLFDFELLQREVCNSHALKVLSCRCLSESEL